MWRISADLLRALDERLGDPVDAYVNGSQTWLVDNGPREITLEWRLHPVAKYRKPPDADTYDVFRRATDGLHDPASLWDGLEVFAAYDDPTTAPDLRAAAIGALGLEPTAWGLVDHEAIGDEWERTAGAVSIVELLIGQLQRG